MTRIPLLLLPGLLCDERLWCHQAAALSDIASPIIADLTRDDTLAAMAKRALAAAPERFALAGLSMGGYVAFEILRRAPERVTRLALFDTSAAPDTPDRLAQRRAGISSLAVGRFVGVTKRLLPQLVHADHLDGPVGAELVAMAARVGAEAYLRQSRAILGRPDSRPLLPTITVPTLVAVGEDDALTPPAVALEILRGIRDARFHLFRRCGHLPALERPEETTGLLRDWLTGPERIPAARDGLNAAGAGGRTVAPDGM
jgi:pimeloyl-ACP methyl ester carboxylesterase